MHVLLPFILFFALCWMCLYLSDELERIETTKKKKKRNKLFDIFVNVSCKHNKNLSGRERKEKKKNN
jgi:hypothetical protein